MILIYNVTIKYFIIIINFTRTLNDDVQVVHFNFLKFFITHICLCNRISTPKKIKFLCEFLGENFNFRTN